MTRGSIRTASVTREEGDPPVEDVQPNQVEPEVAAVPRGRGRGRGRGPRGGANSVGAIGVAPRGRGRGRPHGRGVVTEPLVEPEGSVQESSVSMRGRGRGKRGGRPRNQGFVTQDDFNAGMGKLEAAIQALMSKQQTSSATTPIEDDEAEGSKKEGSRSNLSQKTTPEVESKESKGCSYKTFLTCKPPTYLGECNPVLALQWLREMEVVFETSECADKDKVLHATTMLKAEARCWWDLESGKIGPGAARKTSWVEFVKLFKGKYCPRSVIRQLEEEFLRLEQGDMTVQEYTAKFLEKSRFAEAYVSTEEQRVDRYVWGLRSSIRELVMTMNISTFQLAVDAAVMTEREKNRQMMERGTEKRKWEGAPNDSKKAKFTKYDNRGSQKFVEKPCGKCNRVHRGECALESKGCFKCGKMGHMARECPNPRACYQCGSFEHMRTDCPQLKKGTMGSYGGGRGGGTEKKVETPRAPVRAFQMTATEAEEAPDVVTGTFLINSTFAKVLFDSGANRSFISTAFMGLLNAKPKRLDHGFEVEIADDRRVLMKEVLEGCNCVCFETVERS